MTGRQPAGGWPVTRVDLHRWVGKAACVDRPDLPWITDAHQVDAGQRAAMAVVCADCPVLTRCQDAAERLSATAGYWAGTPRDARVLEPAQEPAPALVPAVAWVPHQTRRGAGTASAHTWEQAAITWPTSAAGGGAA